MQACQKLTATTSKQEVGKHKRQSHSLDAECQLFTHWRTDEIVTRFSQSKLPKQNMSQMSLI